MPWKECHKMDQKMEFALKSIGTENFGELCREFGISRKTGYKWRTRFVNQGKEGLVDHSKRPRSNCCQLKEEVVCELVSLKQGHSTWGPEKIRELYRRRYPQKVPSLSSVKRILEKAGMVKKRKTRRVKATERIHSQRIAEKPNDIWTIDFKGWWRDPTGRRCEPLTLRDEYSRYALCVERTADGRSQTVQKALERAFERYGLPLAIRSDNGSPFACTRALMGLSRLSVWWLALGIELERSRPGCPQDNGAHERMHRDIERELAGLESDQKSFDVWRQTFNEQRPHQALGNRTPSEVYQESERQYTGSPDDLEYVSMESRKVQKAGSFRLRNHRVFLSSALSGWSVGLKSEEPGWQNVYFANLNLGRVETETGLFVPYGTKSPEPQHYRKPQKENM